MGKTNIQSGTNTKRIHRKPSEQHTFSWVFFFLRSCLNCTVEFVYCTDCHYINPYLTNGFSHRLDESTFIVTGARCDFYFLSHFSLNFLFANRIAPDGTSRSAASHLGLFCLPMSHKRNARLKRVNGLVFLVTSAMSLQAWLGKMQTHW